MACHWNATRSATPSDNPATGAPPLPLAGRQGCPQPGITLATRTNAARSLDRLKITYSLRAYQVGKEHLSAAEVAAQLALDPRAVFKTLLVQDPRGEHAFAVLSAVQQLDLKALARTAETRSMALTPLDRVQAVTGYVRGGTTALAARKRLPVYLDESALLRPMISVSAGQRGLQIVLAPQDYLRATGATLGGIGRVLEAPD